VTDSEKQSNLYGKDSVIQENIAEPDKSKEFLKPPKILIDNVPDIYCSTSWGTWHCRGQYTKAIKFFHQVTCLRLQRLWDLPPPLKQGRPTTFVL
jgi:hypothetical protein